MKSRETIGKRPMDTGYRNLREEAFFHEIALAICQFPIILRSRKIKDLDPKHPYKDRKTVFVMGIFFYYIFLKSVSSSF